MMSKNKIVICLGIYYVMGMITLNSCGNRRNDKIGSDRSPVRENNILNDSLVLDTTLIDANRIPTKKMDKRNLVVKEWNTNVGANIKVLDHVSTYNPEGKKIEEIEYNSEGKKWRERYEYDSIGYVDLLKDAAYIKVYYTLKNGQSNTIDTLAKVKDFVVVS